MRRMQLFCSSTMLATTLLTGCSTPTLWGPRTASTSGGFTQTETSLSQGASSGNSQLPADPYGQLPAVANSGTSKGTAALTSLVQAGKSMTNSLKFSSKVTPPSDPTMLDNSPANTMQVAADLHYRAGYFRETQNDYVAAGSHYRNVLQKVPTDVRAIAGLGRVQDQLGNTVEAEQHLRRACELAPQDPAVWNDLAHFQARRNDLNSALNSQQQAVTLQPMNVQYRGAMAKLLVDVGRHEEAHQHLAAVHGEAMAHYQLGCLLHDRKLPELAQQHLQHSLALNPTLKPARQMLDQWAMAAARPFPTPTSAPTSGPIARTARLPNP